MLDPYRIRTRIEEINKRLTVLNSEFKPLAEKELTGDEERNAAAERYLQVAIQAALDIANHIIASSSLERPSKESSEVFGILAKEKIISENLSEDLIAATGYRNVLVHEYLEVDRHRTYDIIQNHLSDLSEFAKYIEEFLASKK